MKIAILGWGSLIWDPRCLILESEWFHDGPLLPVEFARISNDSRLTLVLHPASEKVPVLWAYLNAESLDEAINNLKKREGTTTCCIGFVQVSNSTYRSQITELVNDLIEWAAGKSIEAVIWTDLEPNFKEKQSVDLTPEKVINYLTSLPASNRAKAEEYVRKTPSQIRTTLRNIIESKLGWVSI